MTDDVVQAAGLEIANIDRPGKPRIAIVTTQSPLGAPSGALIRLRGLIAAAAEVGDVTTVHVRHAGTTSTLTESERDSMVVYEVPWRSMNKARYLRWLLFGRTPPSLAGFVGATTPSELTRPLDLIVCRPTAAYAAVALPPGIPVIVDVDDLAAGADLKLRTLRVKDATPLRRLFDRFAGWRVRTSWDRYYRHLSGLGHTLLTCSPEDAATIGDPNWVPNGYPIPERPLGVRELNTARFIFVGRLTYPPNARAVDELIEEVWPAIRRKLPDAELVVIGAGSERWTRTRLDASVMFTGEVESLDPFLETALATIMPIRFGGGTRLKVVEALAHRIPVIATDMAVEGLGLEGGTHFLRAETADDFAAHAVTVWSNPPLRVELTDRAHALFKENYSFETMANSFEQVIRRVIRQP